jgi:hypothetical protein
MVKKEIAISGLKLGRKFVVILAGYESGRYISIPVYRPAAANLYLLPGPYYAGTLHSKRKNPARNSKSSNL